MDQKQLTIVVAVIRNEKREILITQRYEPDIPEIHGKWEFPGGGIEFGEDPIDAIKREIREEVGVEVEVIRLLPKIISDTQQFNNRKIQVLVLTYECKIISGTLSPNLQENIGEIKFVSLDEIGRIDTFQNIRDTLTLL